MSAVNMQVDSSQLGLVSIEQFCEQNPYTPPPPSTPRLPQPQVLPTKLERNYGEHAAAFHKQCDQRGLKPDFEFHEVAAGCFNVTLKIQNQIVDQVGQYASKRDAKEDICRLSLGKLDAFGILKKSKSNSLDAPAMNTAVPPADFDQEEWIGILFHYLSTHQSGFPDFQYSQPIPNAPLWRCELRFHGSPLIPFGAQSGGPYKSKTDAKKVAAMEAVLWLRQQGQLADASALSFHNPAQDHKNAKRRKPGDMIPPSALITAEDAESVWSPTTVDEPLAVGARMNLLAASLNILQPTFRSEQREGAFLNAWAEFSPRDSLSEPRLVGQVGRVNSIYGKKHAKEACWREVLKVLGEIQRSRLKAAPQPGESLAHPMTVE